MLASLSGRLQSLEQCVERQDQELKDIVRILSPTDTSLPGKSSVPADDTISLGEKITPLVLRQAFAELQCEVKQCKQIGVFLKKLSDKVDCQENDIAELKSWKQRIELQVIGGAREKVKDSVIPREENDFSKFRYNPYALEFKPSGWDRHTTETHPTGAKTKLCVISLGTNITDHQQQRALPSSPKSGHSTLVPVTTTVSENAQCQAAVSPRAIAKTIQRPSAPGDARNDLASELATQKTKVQDLEAELMRKNNLIQEILADRAQQQEENSLNKDGQKQDWFEHKMRLLKQDKRRRGETIGKLLRCIDDLKVSLR